MSLLRPPGDRDTPERDVRTSLLGTDQAQLDERQNIVIRDLERRMTWFALAVVFLGAIVITNMFYISTHHDEKTATTCPVCPACPQIPTCPSLTCPMVTIVPRHRTP